MTEQLLNCIYIYLITSVRLIVEQIQLVAIDIQFGSVGRVEKCLVYGDFLENTDGEDL